MQPETYLIIYGIVGMIMSIFMGIFIVGSTVEYVGFLKKIRRPNKKADWLKILAGTAILAVTAISLSWAFNMHAHVGDANNACRDIGCEPTSYSPQQRWWQDPVPITAQCRCDNKIKTLRVEPAWD